MSNDPYLDGVLGAATVEGVQGQGVITSVKVSDIDLPKPLGTENDAVTYSISLPTSKNCTATPPSTRTMRASRLFPVTSMTRQCTSCTFGLSKMRSKQDPET